MPGVPLGDIGRLQKLAREFDVSRSRTNPLYGCMGGVDGVSITICKPPNDYAPRKFYCRKGMYALLVQADLYT